MAYLLGGIHRREIPFTDSFNYRLADGDKGGERSIADVVDDCLGLRAAHGTTWFESKVSDPDPGANFRLVQALRAALGPDAMLRFVSACAGAAGAGQIPRPGCAGADAADAVDSREE